MIQLTKIYSLDLRLTQMQRYFRGIFGEYRDVI